MHDIDLIINKPQALNIQNKLTSISFTFILWIVLFYLWQPLISLIAWFFGYKLFYEHMIILGGYEGFFEILSFYFYTILILGSTLITWAKYNKIRYKNKVRRNNKHTVSAEEMSEFFKVDPNFQALWKNEKNLSINVTIENQITVKSNIKGSVLDNKLQNLNTNKEWV